MTTFKSLALSVLTALIGISTVHAEINIEDIDTSMLSVPAAMSVKSATNTYIVRLAEMPVAAYDGEIKGYKATRPMKGRKLNPQSSDVKAYSGYLTSRHDDVLKSVGGKSKLYSYKYAYNGFAATLTKKQADSLRSKPGVLTVVADELMKPDTISTSGMLGLESGIWNDLGGQDNAGEGVIVGIIDSGIWPENPSFSDRGGVNPVGKDGKLNFRQIPGWHGKCTPGQNFPASKCNQKLIGAQWFNAGFGGNAGISSAFPYEFLSTRDADGHGSHTASTAAGNSGVPVNISGISGTASGMAPRARIAAYKVCWGVGEGGCFGSDSVAAIDQAVIDGVDVLNFSISGSTTSFLDQVEVAFLFAADAGVFVAASAGNSGPGASTVAHNSPWLTTVAAGTHDRGYEATITTGDANSYTGASIGSGAGPADFVYSSDVVASGADSEEGRKCYPGTLDSAAATGKIVLCDRGDIARVDKSLAVAQAGGIGMVLANVSPGSLNADNHSVPSIHVDVATGNALRAYAQTTGAKATISAGVQIVAEASEIAGFSSRGPALAGEGDLLKPDIMAPGVDVIAAISPYSAGGENFAAYSGTSMSSPHMAGLAALMKQAHPSWSPAAIKSAFMTTATQQTNKGNPIAGDAFGYGAGFVQPNAAVDPGLVYDAGFIDWLGFLCVTGQLEAGFCPGIAIDPSNLNYPSIAIGSLVGSQVVRRTVTNVGATGSYTPTVDGLAGIDVSISPSILDLDAGEQASYQVTFATNGAPVDAYVHGGITWSDGTHNVRSPVAVKPVKLAVPGEVTETGTSGSTDFDVVFGYTGDYSANFNGLVAADTQAGTVVDDPANDINTALGTGVGVTFHLVDSSTTGPLTRISLFNDYTDGDDDLDMYVWTYPGFNFVGSSGSGSSAEQVDVVHPNSSLYFVAVHGWETDGSDSNYTLFSWSPDADEGNTIMTAPAAATAGTTGNISLSWGGLDPAKKHMGVVVHKEGVSELKQTVIRVDTD